MAVTLDVTGALQSNTAPVASPLTYSGITVGTGSNRALVLMLNFTGNTPVTALPGGTGTVTVTWDQGGTNQVMTQIGTFVDSTNSDILFMFAVLNPISGNKSLQVSWSNGTSSQSSLCAISFNGVDQTSIAAAFPNFTTNSGSSTTSSVIVTSDTGHIALAMTESASLLSAPNQTSLFIDNAPTDGSAGQYSNGSASVSFTWTLSASTPWSSIGIDVSPGGGTVQLRAPHITKLPPFPFIPTPPQSYNAALYTVTITLPFNQTDWSTTARVSDWLPQPQAGINPNLFTNPFPFNQNDWAKGFDLPSVPNLLPPLNINLFTNPYPFNQYDWSKPVKIPRASFDLSVQFNQNLTNFFPFNQTDWSKPFNAPHAPFDLSVPLNPNIFTNPIPILNVQGLITGWGVADLPVPQQPYNSALYTVTVTGTPFNQTYWPPPVRVSSAPVDFYNLVFYNTIVLPFNQVDWSKPFTVPRAAPDQTVSLNPNIFTNPYPVLNVDASRPTRLSGLPQVDSPYNQSLYTVIITGTPFNQTYWPPSIRVPNAPVDFYNLVLYDIVTLPFNQIDWSKPFAVPRAPFDKSVALNPNLFTNPYPIQNIDSAIVPPRRATVLLDQTYNQSLYTVTVTGTPFNQTYWPLPVRVASAPVDFYNLVFYNTIVLPFSQVDWLKPFTGLRAPLPDPPLNINLFTNPIPIFNYDRFVSVKLKGFVDTSQPYNVNLYGVVTVQVPFNQVDWSRTFVPRPAPTRDEALNINLFTNPIPFSQYDWRKPFGVPHAPFDLSVQINLNLFTNPFPFNQYQYPTQRPVILGPPHVPPYNQNLYTATIGTTSHIVKFIGNVGHFMIR